MAENLGINPMYLIVPCAASVSMAFCLPVSTPPNAVVFEYGMSDLGIVLKKWSKKKFRRNPDFCISLYVIDYGQFRFDDEKS